MFRFLRITLILWLLSVALIGGAALYGRAHNEPNELQSLGFDVCEGRLCFRRIVPGVTTANDAAATLVNQGATKIPTSLSAYLINHVRVQLSDSSGPVANISIEQDQLGKPLPATVGNFIHYLGNPCRLDMIFETVNLRKYRATLIYPYGYISAVLSTDQSLNPMTPVQYVFIFLPYASADECDRGLPWLGFKTFARYQEIQIKQFR